MVKHAGRYNGSLVQVTHVSSVDPTCCNLAEWWMYHNNRGCCLATIISCLHVVSSVKGEGKDNNKIDKEMVKRKRAVV